MEVTYETATPVFSEDDRVTAYGSTGTLIELQGEKHALVQFDGRAFTESVPLRKLSRA